jgi:hypothetical protein
MKVENSILICSFVTDRKNEQDEKGKQVGERTRMKGRIKQKSGREDASEEMTDRKENK